MAGFLVPVNAVVPPPAFVSVSVEAIESCARGSGEVIEVELRVIVAAVPSWVAVRVAAPPPPSVQVASIVAVSGLTAAAVGARARPVAARVQAAAAAVMPSCLRLIGFPSLVRELPWGDGGTAPVSPVPGTRTRHRGSGAGAERRVRGPSVSGVRDAARRI